MGQRKDDEQPGGVKRVRRSQEGGSEEEDVREEEGEEEDEDDEGGQSSTRRAPETGSICSMKRASSRLDCAPTCPGFLSFSFFLGEKEERKLSFTFE